jgi:hypothetical protein
MICNKIADWKLILVKSAGESGEFCTKIAATLCIRAAAQTFEASVSGSAGRPLVQPHANMAAQIGWSGRSNAVCINPRHKRVDGNTLFGGGPLQRIPENGFQTD